MKDIPFPFIGKKDIQGNIIDPQCNIPDIKIHLEYTDSTSPWYEVFYQNDGLGAIWEEHDGFVVQGRRLPHTEFDYIEIASGYDNPTDAVKRLIEHQTRLLGEE